MRNRKSTKSKEDIRLPTAHVFQRYRVWISRLMYLWIMAGIRQRDKNEGICRSSSAVYHEGPVNTIHYAGIAARCGNGPRVRGRPSYRTALHLYARPTRNQLSS